jgi:hypothetical protein
VVVVLCLSSRSCVGVVDGERHSSRYSFDIAVATRVAVTSTTGYASGLVVLVARGS